MKSHRALIPALFALNAAVFLTCGTASAPSTQRIPSPDWPVFRGDAQLRGTARGTISDSLRKRWSVQPGAAMELTAPVLDSQTVYVGSFDGHLYALSLSDGAVRWSYKTKGRVEAAPLKAFGLVFAGDRQGVMHALDAASGIPVWTFATSSKITGSANFVAGVTPRLLFAGHSDTLYCLDARSGALLWAYGAEGYLNGTPATDAAHALIGGCDEQLHLVALDDGVMRGRAAAGSYVAASAAIDSGMAWVGQFSEELLCLALPSLELVWRFRARAPLFASPAVGDSLIVISCQKGFIYGVCRFTGEQRWIAASGGAADASPVICGQRVIAGSNDGHLYIADLASGTIIRSIDIGAPLLSAAVGDGAVVVADAGGRVTAFW